jgi:diguanylate cyclase (GGDEF)-like protein
MKQNKDSIKELVIFTKTLKILFIEDDEDARVSTLRILGNFFTDITTSNDGLDGLNKFKNDNSYDLIITDLDMPKMDGLLMIENMRQIDAQIPILIVSAIRDTTQFTKCIKLNVNGYCLKPINMDDLLDAISKVTSKILLQKKVEDYEYNLEKKVAFQAKLLEDKYSVDTLTELLTRERLLKDLLLKDENKAHVLILINIDEFRTYNELYGINVGNEILQKFAKNLILYNQNKDYKLYRVAGDEFVLYKQVIFVGIEEYEKDLKQLYKYIQSHLITIKSLDKDLELDITTGISFSSINPLDKANMALHKAKKEGRNFTSYHHDLDREKELKENLYWKDEIKKAVKEKRVIPFYQPIVNRVQEIVKYEALVRIKQVSNDGDIKYVTPEKFLKLSEKTKQYILLTSTVIEEALYTMSEKNINISINITYQDIKNESIYQSLKKSIKKYNIAQQTKFDISNNVIFELLENESIECFESFKTFIEDFKELGVQIIIDDFGTGFSNFGQIVGLSPHYIKIDGFLIESVNTDKKSLVLIRAIIKFAKELGIKTIASFVSSQDIFKTIHDLGVDEFQGSYFGEAKLENFLEH